MKSFLCCEQSKSRYRDLPAMLLFAIATPSVDGIAFARNRVWMEMYLSAAQ
jgi:hypothetical protein